MPRTSKNETKVIKRRLVNKYYAANGSVIGGSDGFSTLEDTFREIRNTNNTPGFRSQRQRTQKDQLPMNDFSYFKNRITWPTGSARREYSDGTYETWVGGLNESLYLNNSAVLTDDIRNAVDSAALHASLSDLKGMKVNLGVAFAERNRTAKLLLDTAGRFGDAIGSLKKGNIKGALNRLGYSGKRRPPTSSHAVSADWLAIQYGWKPLVSDVYGAAEALAAHGKYVIRVSSSRTHRWAGRNNNLNEQCNSVPVQRFEAGSYTRKYVYIFSRSSEVLTDLTSVGITNPLAIAWEILPWSFVFDWFLKVGEWIDSLDATLGLQFEKGCKTLFERWDIKYNTNGTKLDGGTRYYADFAASASRVRCVRQALSSFEHARRPRLGTGLTDIRAANAIALIRQRTFR